jgi:hypothetical protein
VVYNGTPHTASIPISSINAPTASYTGSTSVTKTNVGIYYAIIEGTGNYTGSITATLTITAARLSAQSINGTREYNGSLQSVNVISGINAETYSGSTFASGTHVGNYPTIITSTDNNYTGSLTAALTITPAALIGTVDKTVIYNGSPQTVDVITSINGTYNGSPSATGTDVGTYETIITGTDNYTGSLTGTLSIIAAANPPPDIIIPTESNPSITNFSPTFNTVRAPFDVIISDEIPTPFTINYSWTIPEKSFENLLKLTTNKESPAITINTWITGESIPSQLSSDYIESIGNYITNKNPVIISNSYMSNNSQITLIESLFKISPSNDVVAAIPVIFSYYIS